MQHATWLVRAEKSRDKKKLTLVDIL